LRNVSVAELTNVVDVKSPGVVEVFVRKLLRPVTSEEILHLHRHKSNYELNLAPHSIPHYYCK